MKLCIVGKYPPIQGGVSSSTYWLARGLALRGHEVHVVTNADEVEAMYRMDIDATDREWMEGRFPNTGGSLQVHGTTAFDPRGMSHIPLANPFVSKLAGVAADVVTRHGCEMIVAYYFEPYAVAGWMASRWTDRPLMVKHAGSDLDRLMQAPALATTYKHILRSAETVVTQPGLMSRFLGIGVGRAQLESDVPFGVPTSVFRPRLDDGEDRRNHQPPSIGIYGKVGGAKGTFDLIDALGVLAAEGLDFQLRALIGPRQADYLEPALRRAGLRDRTVALPFVPHWRVPEFIRSCTAVCFLERDFPVAIHGPIVPREVLACGACLVVSGDISSRQRFLQPLNDGEDLVVVDDPKDHGALATKLRWVLEDPARCRAIGRRGLQVSESIEHPESYAEGWEDLLERRLPARVGNAPVSAPGAQDLLAPPLWTAARERWPDLANSVATASSGHHPFAVALQFCDEARSRVAGLPDGEDRAKLEAALRYQHRSLTASSDFGGEVSAEGAEMDRLGYDDVTSATARGLVPVASPAVQIEQFHYDVLPLFASAEAVDDVVQLSDLQRSELLVVFLRSPALVRREVRIDASTRELLSRCDGSMTVEAVADSMCAWFGVEPGKAAEAAHLKVWAALEQLHALSIVLFTEGTGSERELVTAPR